jgi:hypothetical protein
MKRLSLFRSGELVVESGVYAVLHSTPHALIQHVAHTEGDHFEECKMCPLGVWYRLEVSNVRTSERMFPQVRIA